MEMLPQATATELSGNPAGGTLPHHECVGPEADQDTSLETLQSITTEDEMKECSTEKGGEEAEPESFGHSTLALEISLNSSGLEEAPAGIHRKKGFAFNCEHVNFPLCECVARAANPRPNHGRLGRRPGRRSHRGPTLATLRDIGLEVFDETEESDFQESETETENLLADTTDAESDYTAGLESDVEGAVGGDDPNQLAPPSTTGQRRASIVTADSRRDDISPSPEPIKVAVFGTDGVGKSALIVRLLTGRFIGEYDPTLEAVMDTAGHVEVVEVGRERQVSWGEGFMLVFSLTSHDSFTSLNHLRRVILELTPGSPRPMVLVGNKADLVHAREVSDEEIRDLANTWGCDYFEVAAPEPWQVVVRPFAAIYQAVLNGRASH
ncbi:hypothetical protein O3P69_017903 [Scylla paramamosain]|uniref:small monomeric GTPase n=1 Tax=Scylla paramamosain TaxID=85552 RepID=A0AAW0THI5_SCYPA